MKELKCNQSELKVIHVQPLIFPINVSIQLKNINIFYQFYFFSFWSYFSTTCYFSFTIFGYGEANRKTPLDFWNEKKSERQVLKRIH